MTSGMKLKYTISQYALDTFEIAHKKRKPTIFKNHENLAVGLDTEEVHMYFVKKLDELPDFGKIIRNL